jgi:hypothetical protein
MTGRISNQSVSFDYEHKIFGGFDPDTEKLLVVVEAKNDDEARSCVSVVAPYLGIARSKVLLVIELESMPSGVPTFLSRFFAAGKISINRADVVPGSSTLQ